MQPDQAAGLRRRRAAQPLRCIHCGFGAAESTSRLAHALHRLGLTTLLVDGGGRLFADASPRSLLDWKQQIERGTLRVLPQPYGAGWHAPGVQGHEPALCAAAHDYDYVLFDAGPDATGLAPLAGAQHGAIIEVCPAVESKLRAYALIKAISAGADVFGVVLLGDTSACEHVRAACERFLAPELAQAVCHVVHEDDAIAAHIVKMAAGGDECHHSLLNRTILKYGR